MDHDPKLGMVYVGNAEVHMGVRCKVCDEEKQGLFGWGRSFIQCDNCSIVICGQCAASHKEGGLNPFAGAESIRCPVCKHKGFHQVG